MLKDRLSPAIIVAAVLAILVPLVFKQLGYALTRENATYMLLAIIIVAYTIEAVLRRGRK